jgi:hypothetical protein
MPLADACLLHNEPRKNTVFCTGPTRAVKAGQKSLVQYLHDKPNEPSKEGHLSDVLHESPFASVTTK